MVVWCSGVINCSGLVWYSGSGVVVVVWCGVFAVVWCGVV